MYYSINETTARHAKEMSSFSDYVPGSATAEYQAAVDEAAALVEAKKAKQNAREDSLWREYDDIKALLDQIRGLGTGPVDLADPDARQLLQHRLQALEAQSARGKAMNAHYRRHKTMKGFPGLSDAQATAMDADLVSDRNIWHVPRPAYKLTSIRDKIKRTQNAEREASQILGVEFV